MVRLRTVTRPRSGLSGSLLGVMALVGALLTATMPSYAVGARPDPIGQDAFTLDQGYRGDFPDPTILHARGKWFAYSTSTAGLNLPVLVSTNLKRWTVTGPRGAAVPDAMPKAPTWARSHTVGQRRVAQVWAPTVVRLTSGRFAAVYTVQVGKLRMCISVARATFPRGPFADASTAPLLCPYRGAIDPSIHRERGRTYLLYKTEDARHGQATRLWIRRIKNNLRAFAEPTPHLLMRADQTDWERGVIEAPSMIRFKGHRYLFYSGNGWGRRGYSTGYALCASVTGPCARPLPTPGSRHPERLLVTDDQLVAPGGASAFIDSSGRLRLVFHAWDVGATQYPTSIRCRTKPAGCGQRRMHLAVLGAHRNGILVTRRIR